MQVLRRRYVERAATDRAALAVAVESEDWIEVRRIAHGNSGTGATFSFPDVSARGQELEEAVDAGLPVSERRKLAHALSACLDDAAQDRS